MNVLAEALDRPGWECYFRAGKWICILCGATEDDGREDARREHFTRCLVARYGAEAHVAVDDLRMAMFAGANIASGTGAA